MKTFRKALRERKKRSPMSYWGIHKEWGLVFGFKRCTTTPHLRFHPPGITPYCGWDIERRCFSIRPWPDYGIRRLGWRSRMYKYPQ